MINVGNPDKNINKQLLLEIRNIPILPGCYIFKDKYDTLLYIGKSKSLRKRVQSYFRPEALLSPRMKLMVSQIKDIEFIVTDSENEALNLESNLIKEHKPHFNILLKDDKKYPYVCITWSEDYPRIFITRRRRNRKTKDRYYGPYVDVASLRKTLHIIKKVFPIRQRNIPLYKDKTCLNYSIGRCPGVCQEYISVEDYQRIITKIAMILQGRVNELIETLEKQMNYFSELLDFENAAKVRDQIKSLDQISENQRITLPDSYVNRDVFALSKDSRLACIQLFQIRSGKLCGRLGFTSDVLSEDNNIIIQNIIEQYYSQVEPEEIPKEILVDHELPKNSIIENWLTGLKESKVTINNPKKSNKAKFIQLVAKNAEIELERIQQKHQVNRMALEDLSGLLELEDIPRRIEAYDISHIQGSDAVGSQVVFIDALPAKQHYRRYKIKNRNVYLGHSDDYSALSEVIYRRFKKWSEAKKKGIDISNYNSNNSRALHTEGLNDWPDIIVIDGGKGQLSAVYQVLKELNLENEIICVSLAKRNEDLFLPFKKEPIDSSKDQPAISLIRRLRDEAHRFAISYHRKLRGGRMRRSRLSEIPGIGSKMIRELLTVFQSVDAIELATIDQLERVEGVGKQKANLIYNYFHPNKN